MAERGRNKSGGGETKGVKRRRSKNDERMDRGGESEVCGEVQGVQGRYKV